MATFTLSIEPTEGKAYQYGFHLGTIEHIARQCAEDRFNGLNASNQPTRTVALIRDGKIFDTYDGTGWHSSWVDAWLNGNDEPIAR